MMELNNSIDNSLDEVFQISEGIINEVDAREMIDWMAGRRIDPPKCLQKIMTNYQIKMQAMLAATLAQNMTRANKLIAYLQKSDEYVFDVTDLPTDDADDRRKKYVAADKALNNLLEFSRKFAFQSKDMGAENLDKEVDSLKSLLLSLPKERIEKLIAKIESGEV